MRYDPCGRIVDMGRRPYRTRCRPFRDTSTEVEIHWYVTLPANGTLPYPSRINSLDWRDMRQSPSPKGEVPDADREFDGWLAIIPPTNTDHCCGTREDFELGGLEYTDAPPLARGPDGIPLCCRPPTKGIVIGGTAIVQPLSPGGVVLGGVAVQEPEYSFYDITSTDPEESHIVGSQVPPEICTEWRETTDSPTWVLTSTAPRGTSGDWVLTNEYVGATWIRNGWDGTDGGDVVWALVSGSWPGEIRVSEGV